MQVRGVSTPNVGSSKLCSSLLKFHLASLERRKPFRLLGVCLGLLEDCVVHISLVLRSNPAGLGTLVKHSGPLSLLYRITTETDFC